MDMKHRAPIAFGRIASVARDHALPIVRRWLPSGKLTGSEWVCLNPKRADRRTGSFKVNVRSGVWSDFATGDRGGDLVSLAAFLFDLSQAQAALRVAAMLGIDAHDQ